MPVISGRHNRRQLFVDVVILDVRGAPEDQTTENALAVSLEPLRALIDTGATATSITPNAAKKLALRIAGRQPVLTASGITEVPFYFFRVGFTYPVALEPVSQPAAFHVLPEPVVGSELIFDNSPFDILLGMDVLSQGDLKVLGNGEFSFEF